MDVATGWTRCYDLAWPLGFVLSASVHVLLSRLFPPTCLGQTDLEDVFGTFTERFDDAQDVTCVSDLKSEKASV